MLAQRLLKRLDISYLLPIAHMAMMKIQRGDQSLARECSIENSNGRFAAARQWHKIKGYLVHVGTTTIWQFGISIRMM
jgi:hypothetical protein